MSIDRLNYFTGELLDANDFNAEQSYHLEMRKSHNLRLHTSGVVEGLDITIGGDNSVTIGKGMAIDPLGREIIIDAPLTIPVTTTPAEVAIRLDVQQTMPTTETGVTGNKRWTEKAVADSDDPNRVVLGRIVKGDSGLQLDGNYRRKTSGPAVPGDLIIKKDREVFFEDGGQIRSSDNNHRILFRRTENKLELREFGDIVFSSGAQSGAETAKAVLLRGGNFGIGTAAPIRALHVNGELSISPPDKKNAFINISDANGNGSGTLVLRGLDAAGSKEVDATFRMTGRVGIGDSNQPNPADRLVVTGGRIAQVDGGTLGDGGGKWSTLGVPNIGVSPNLPNYYGLKVNWNTDSVIFGLRDYGENRKDAVIAWGDDANDNLRFLKPNDADAMIITGAGNVGIGTPGPNDLLDVAGSVRLLTGSNPIRFTSSWSGFSSMAPDQPTNQAEISNDTSQYKTLMIVGNKSEDGKTRKVSVWDTLSVYGYAYATGGFQTTSANAFRMVSGSFGVFFRNDGSDTYLLTTKEGDPWGGWNDRRPLRVNNASGDVWINNALFSRASDGSVGIGTAAPIRALHVNGEFSLSRNDKTGYINISDVNGDGGGKIVLRGLDSKGAAATDATVQVVGNLCVNADPTDGFVVGRGGRIIQLQGGSLDGNGKWSALGVPTLGFAPNTDKFYGLKVNWDSDSVIFGLKEYGANRKDAVIAWGDDANDNLRFLKPNDSDAMIITGAGNVGIGTANPAAKLTVGGDGVNVYGTDLWIEHNIHVQGNETLNQGGKGRLRLGSAWNCMAIYTDPSSTGAANDLLLGASSNLVRIGIPTSGTNLAVSGNATVDGRVGIGTSSPGEKLMVTGGRVVHLEGGSFDGNGKWSSLGVPTAGFFPPTIDKYYGLTVNWNSDYAVFGLRDYGENRKDAVIAWGDDANDNLRFMKPNDADAMIITGAGNVGIGTPAPSAMLEVAGRAIIQTSLSVGSGASATGADSVALGVQSLASGIRAIAIGDSAKATAQEAIAIGSDMTVSGMGSVGIRLGAGGTAAAVTASNVMAIVGGNVGIGDSPADRLFVTGGRIIQHESGNPLDAWGKWTAIGVGTLGFTPTSDKLYGVKVNWDSDAVIFGLREYGANRKDAVVVWGDDPDDNLRFMKNDADVMIITGAGNVGIGTTTPASKLTVAGSIAGGETTTGWVLGRGAWAADNWLRITKAQGSDQYHDLAVNAFWAAGGKRFDLAEVTPVKEEDRLEPGDAVVIENVDGFRVTRSSTPYDTSVYGIVSSYEQASMVIGGEGPESARSSRDKAPIALIGRVKAKVSAINGPIGVGDLLTTSSIPGHLMKCGEKRGGAIAGKALEPMENGEGMILVLVTLQ